MKGNLIKWFTASTDLSEIYQKTGMLFAFATKPDKNDQQEMCHQWVKCRDFLHDAVKVQIAGKTCSIYGFKYTRGENPPIDLKRMRMLVTKNLHSEAEIIGFNRKITCGLGLLRLFEKHMKISLSSVTTVDPSGSEKKSVFLFTGSSIWMKSPLTSETV